VRPDWIVVALSAAGLVVSGYLTWLKWAGGGASFCIAGSSCDIVQASRYATFLGVPTALWGGVLYIAIGALGWLGLAANRWLAAFLLAAAGAGFSLYLTYLSLFVIGGACVYCLASGAIILALLLVLIWRRPSASGRRSPFRPIRLATNGVLAAVAAVVFGAFVHAAPSSAPAGYQLALARHLKETKAVMYGAFW
jgi:uncharacterized membrane protein